ncbi:MAG: hypothetical protein ACPHT9_01515 [Flavobacteriaceae bacterium]
MELRMYNFLIGLRNQKRSIGVLKLCFIFASQLAYGVTGNTSNKIVRHACLSAGGLIQNQMISDSSLFQLNKETCHIGLWCNWQHV